MQLVLFLDRALAILLHYFLSEGSLPRCVAAIATSAGQCRSLEALADCYFEG